MNVLRIPLLESDRFCWRLEDLMKTGSLGVEYIFPLSPCSPICFSHSLPSFPCDPLWFVFFFLIPKKSNIDRPRENLNVLE